MILSNWFTTWKSDDFDLRPLVVTIPCKRLDWRHWSSQTTCADTAGRVRKFENWDRQLICAAWTLSRREIKIVLENKYTSRHWFWEVIHCIGGLGRGSFCKSAKKNIPGNIKLGLTSSTRPAIDIDFGQISAGGGTSLNYDKVMRRGLCPYTDNASDTNDTVCITIVTS